MLAWSMALSALCLAVGYFYATRDVEPERVVIAEPAKPDAKPEVKLSLVVTECSEITSRVDFEGGIMVNLGENYRQIKGHVTNTGDLAVKLVGVDTVWKNKADKVIQMGKVYVATEAALKPGDRVEFSDATKNYLAVKCSARVNDWWVAPNQAATPEAG